jgi:TonB family protein
MWGRERLEGVRSRLRAVRDRLPDLGGRFQAAGDRFPRVSAFVSGTWGWVRDEPLAGIVLSVLLHVLIIGLVVYLGGPGSTYNVKRGEPLFVELPEIKDQAPRGNPAAREPGPPAAPSPAPTPPPVAKATPAAPKAPPPAPPRSAPKAPEPPRVASARPPEPVRERPPAPAEKSAPRPPEPPAADAKDAVPAPSTPAPPAPASPAVPAAATPAAPTSAPPGPASEPARTGAPGPQVASIPPGSRESVFDLRSLGRGGGAGGRGEGRGGIEGEPIPLDTRDPKYSDYLDRIRRMIKERWGYPCIKTGASCEYKTAELVIEFGIAKDGKVPFVNLVRTSGYTIYDDYALNAIKLASPFPPVPDSLSKKGFPIMARFHYVVDTSLVNTLR